VPITPSTWNIYWLGDLAANFDGNSARYLSHPYHVGIAPLTAADATGMSVAVWFNPDTLAASGALVSTWVDDSAPNPVDTGNYEVQLNLNQIRFGVGTGIASNVSFAAGSHTVAAIGTWNLFIGSASITDGTILSQLNGAAAQSSAAGVVVQGVSGSLSIGRRSTGPLVSQALPFTGGIDTVAIWDRVLTATERTQLYNGGTGLKYRHLATFYPTLLTGLSAWWEMDEVEGTRYDAHAAFDLVQPSLSAIVGYRTGKS
jgi:hypothetical protein